MKKNICNNKVFANLQHFLFKNWFKATKKEGKEIGRYEIKVIFTCICKSTTPHCNHPGHIYRRKNQWGYLTVKMPLQQRDWSKVYPSNLNKLFLIFSFYQWNRKCWNIHTIIIFTSTSIFMYDLKCFNPQKK